MKHLAKLLIKIYRFLFPSVNRNCRFTPTCSEYFIDALEKHGVAKGVYLGVLRLLSCHPLSKRSLYDPA